ncbi:MULTISPECIES: pentapeptide repeat-containing protein [Streptomyces]|uniref:pentapeptide repeat-containing protein n=1 Tax=Streptomyces TaxID=1883 RepID=UPI00292A5333|nr:pentapeptide repeat-containing protein [Streptomyces odorifer]
MTDDERSIYLAGLTPGAYIDHRGTSFSSSLLDALLSPLRDTATGRALLGAALFDSAIFEGHAIFSEATFQGVAQFESAAFQGSGGFAAAAFESLACFESATFQAPADFGTATFAGQAVFESATFESYAGFDGAIFEGPAVFGLATFRGAAVFTRAAFESNAGFSSATFQNIARFESVTFGRHAGFGSATFQSSVVFSSATFQDIAVFTRVTFQGFAGFSSATFQGLAGFGWATFGSIVVFASATFHDVALYQCAEFLERVSLGPMVAGTVDLSAAVFNGPTTLAFAARELVCQRTRFLSTAELQLRHATVDLSHAVLEYPLTVAGQAEPFALFDGAVMPEQFLAGAAETPARIASLRGVDAAHLVLADVDLSGCLFTGTVHLDQVRLEGACTFAAVPSGTHWRRGRPTRFTPRRVLAEEHHWRARQPAAVQGWRAAEPGTGQPGPAQLAPVYRALRKAFEDSKNEPGAADFYYGEMEMRRNDRATTSRAERGLLHAYWMLSGYGLRALRAMGWLAAAMLTTVVLLMGFGLPKEDPKQEATGTVPPGGGKVTFEIEKADPQNPTANRFTGKRFEKALNVTFNSVVFRSSGQDLTTAGTYIEMTSRLVEPTLLALSVLAVRGRIKR